MTKYSSRRGAAVTQRDGSSLASSNCRMASIATGLDFHTEGAKTSTGAKMRGYCSDQSGGTDSSDARESWDRGYGQSLRVRDGYSFDDALTDLRAGREVHLDVWAASVGGVCLSGTGAYGHTIVVAPEKTDSGWAVSDPWCNPPKWAFVSESKLRAGAEEWGRRVFSSATSGPLPAPWDQLSRETKALLLALAAKRLMSEHNPDNPDPDGLRQTFLDAGETGGGAILYTTTKALPIETAEEVEAMDWHPLDGGDGTVVIRSGRGLVNLVTGKAVTPDDREKNAYSRAHLAEPWSADSGMQDGYLVRHANQAHIALDGTVESFTPAEPEPAPEPPDTDELLAERDEEWLAWLTEGAPSVPAGTPPPAPTRYNISETLLRVLWLLAIIGGMLIIGILWLGYQLGARL